MNNSETVSTSNSFSKGLIENFIIFLDEYKALKKTKSIEVLFKYFGIKSESFTLEDIGKYYNNTRERIRQLKEKELRIIKFILLDDWIGNTEYKCSNELTEQTLLFQKILNNRNTISYGGLKDFLGSELNTDLSEDNRNYLNLLMSILEFDSLNFLSNQIYFRSSVFNKKALPNLLNVIKKLLAKKIYLYDEDALIIDIKKNYKLKSLENKDLLNLLSGVNEFEKITEDGRVFYQLRFDQLPSAGFMGVRMLKECKNEKSIHRIEIVRKINQKLKLYNSNEKITEGSLIVQFNKLKNIVEGRKNGYWSLKELNQDTNDISSLIENALLAAGYPLSYKEIFNYVTVKRPEIGMRSILSTVGVYKNKFLKLQNRKIILKEWKNRFKDELTTGSKKLYDDNLIMKKIVAILEEKHASNIKSKELRKLLENEGIKFKGSTFNAKLAKYPILERPNKSAREVKLKENHQTILATYELEKDKKLKTDMIKQEMITLLNQRDNKILQAEFIKILKDKFSFSGGTLYKILKDEQTFKKITNADGRIYVSINDVKNKGENFINDVSSLIQGGETNNVEFKSSLRWDTKENRTNKELEYEIAKTIAAFLNSSGGNLFIGINDEKEALGLDNDFKTLNKKNLDGFELQLKNVIHSYLGKDIHDLLGISFPKHSDKTICKINVKVSKEPVFIKKNDQNVFIIRAGNSTLHLDIKEAVDYIKRHWGK